MSNRLINPKKVNYYKELLSKFSEDSRLMSSGIAKGFASKKFTWIADMLFKHRGNTSTNIHQANLAFFNNKEIAYQEYGNIPEVYNEYKFLQDYNRSKLPENYYELSSKQYAKIGQKSAECDTVEYIDAANKILNSVGTVDINHIYNDVPIFHGEGYLIQGYSDDKARYMWVDKSEHTAILNANNFQIEMGADQSESFNTLQNDIITGAPGTITRNLDYKIQVDHKNFFYFEDSDEWVAYYNYDGQYHGTEYRPYFGGVICYDEDNNEIQPDNIYFLPEVLVNWVYEPAKLIIKWPSNKSGKVAFNSANTNNAVDDQSRLVFGSCKHMFNDDGSGDIKLYKEDVDTNIIYDGIDLVTERNRRHSATVMTDPYFAVDPISNGAIVDYKFVNRDDDPVAFATSSDFIDRPGLYLKVKTDLRTLRELDRLLAEEEYSSDIINTFTIKNPRSAIPTTVDEYYTEFNKTINGFYERQDDTLADLLGGTIGSAGARRFRFEINKYGSDSDFYTDYMKVSGLGFYTEIETDSDGIVTGDAEYLSIYCSNHNPDGYTSNTFLNSAGSGNIYRTIQGERFRPMLKLPGINGYVKILKKNTVIQTVRTADGKYESVYNVEFPYCPGSYTERSIMDFSTSGYLPTQILYKKNYIPAGSEAAYGAGDSHYEIVNDRHVTERDKAFGYMEFCGIGGSYETSYYKNGGGLVGGATVKKTINYPISRACNRIEPNLLYAEISDSGTVAHGYQVYLDATPDKNDYQLFILTDNQKWRYDTNKFESYINRENPSYVFKVDVSALYNDYTENQKDYPSIPDLKRWLYEYLKSFAYTTDLNGNPISTKDSSSDTVIEIWDTESLIGATRGGNWRAVSPLTTDSNKFYNEILSDGLYRYGSPAAISGVSNFFTIKLGYYSPPALNHFPQEFNASSLDLIKNKVLYDSQNERCYHIAEVRYLMELDPGEEEGYEIDIEWIGGTDPDLPTDGGISIAEPQKFINKSKNFELYSSSVKTDTSCRVIRKYFDIRSTSGSNTDIDRYIVDNNVYFRIRVVNGREYPTTKIDIDNDGLQFVREVIQGVNIPWKPLGVFQEGFDWSEINQLEMVDQFGIVYFRCASK